MIERQPFFSIIIPTYARRRQLARCLDAIVRLDYPHDRFEVIVVDDGGETPLDGVVAPHRDQLNLTLVSQRHAGPAMARNTGASRAKGRFLAFTDDDCMPAVDWLRTLAVRLMAEPDCAVGGQTLNALPDNPFSTTSQMLITYLYTYYNATPEKARFFTSNNLAFPTDLLLGIGGFDTTYTRTAAEDRELCDRWRHHGYRLVYAPQAIVYHAHALTLRTLWRQHVNYGRGAFQFRQARARRSADRIRMEPLSFYLDLLRHPHPGGYGARSSLLLSSLLALSQVANATGFLLEWWSRAMSAEQPAPGRRDA